MGETGGEMKGRGGGMERPDRRKGEEREVFRG